MQSELALIARIARATTVRPGVVVGIGDDAAVLAGEPQVVVTHDMLVDGVHFRRATSAVVDIGYKALAVNLSDIAAMGAVPVAAIVGLGLPAEDPLRPEDVDVLYAGMDALAAEHGVTIAGGDITRAPTLVISVTATGTMPAGVAPCLRSGARPGELVCVTGALGAAAAGLILLERPDLDGETAHRERLVAASRRPTPRVAAGQRLAAGGATAMMDCSDGLALDTSRLASASHVAIELDLETLPIAPGVDAVAAATESTADVLAATGGDDYELIVTAPDTTVAALRRLIDIPLTTVGRVVAGSGVTLLRGGAPVVLSHLGWEHHV